MFHILDSFFYWILTTLFLLLCLVFALFRSALNVLETLLSTPPLLAFILLGTIGIVVAAQQYSKYQKVYFEKHSKRKI